MPGKNDGIHHQCSRQILNQKAFVIIQVKNMPGAVIQLVTMVIWHAEMQRFLRMALCLLWRMVRSESWSFVYLLVVLCQLKIIVSVIIWGTFSSATCMLSWPFRSLWKSSVLHISQQGAKRKFLFPRSLSGVVSKPDQHYPGNEHSSPLLSSPLLSSPLFSSLLLSSLLCSAPLPFSPLCSALLLSALLLSPSLLSCLSHFLSPPLSPSLPSPLNP